MYQYPYGNAQQLNLDWILNKLKELESGAGGGGTNLEEVSNALIALTYAEQNYNLSDIVFYDGKLYSANQNITAESWNPDHWNEVLLANPVSNLVRYVSALNNTQVFNSSNVAGTHTSDALNNLASDISDLNGAINTLAALRAKMGAKNLLPFPYEEDTKITHGITYTVNSDSSITINGTNTHTGMVHFNLSRGINWTGYRLHLIYSIPDNNISIHYNNNVLALSIDVSYQATINNVTVYPMVLDPLETELTPFEKYAKTNVELTKDITTLNGAITQNETDTKNKTVFLANKVLNAQHNFNNAVPELTLVHFSDIHHDTAALERIMAEIANIPNVDDVICTGDMVQNTYGEIASWWNPNVLTVIGNHDTASYSGGVYNWTALSVANRIAYYISPFENNWGINRPSGKSYYYKDYTTQKVRLIVLDGMLYMASDTTEATAQTSWLSGLLDSAITAGLHVLIAIHAPSVGAMPLHCDFTKLNETVFPALTDCATPASIPNLIETKKANGLNFIGYICGHWHQDGIYFPNNTKQLEYCITTANVVDTAQWQANDQFRNTTMDAYNVISIDTANNTIKIVRGGGADIDCYMRPRKEISFNYAERRINTLAPLEDAQYYDPNNALTQDTQVNISEYLNGNYVIVTCARFGYQATEIIPVSILRDSAPRMYFYNSSGAGKNTVLKFWGDGRMKVESTDDPVFVLLAQI